jgi:hypothetical protein
MHESYTAVVIRVEEGLKNLKETNFTAHAEIIDNIKDLKVHVNDELNKFDIRVKKCEDSDKTIAIVYKIVIVGLSIALTLKIIGVW